MFSLRLPSGWIKSLHAQIPLQKPTSAVAHDFHQSSAPPACSGCFLPTGKYPFSCLLPQNVLSLHPTHILHLLVLAELSPNTNALTDRPNPANDPYKLALTQSSYHSGCFLPVGWTRILQPFISPFLQLVTLVSDSSPLPAGPLFAPCLCGCAERWRSLCGTWWCCWHVYSPLDAVTARGSVWPAVSSCSSSSCSELSTPWWVCAYVCVSLPVVVSHCW